MCYETCRFWKRFLVLPGILLFAVAAESQVAPTTIFQLDGNAAQSAGYPACTYGSPCDYWNLLNGSGNSLPSGGIGTGSSAGHSSIRTFVNGNVSDQAFTGGGSKDPNLISQWAYSVGSTPPKDHLNAAYAAGYQLGGDFEIMFGADRNSGASGDANIGIWFFQQKVAPNGSGGFTGAHVNHDIFLISAFTGGGGTSTIEALEWDSGCASGVKNPTVGQCADTNLRLLADVGLSNICTSTSAFCAITNAAATTTTWEGVVQSPWFFEGGADITFILAQAGITNLPCFASFLVETRSSQSTTAVLKDFIAGSFPVCSVSITKNCDTNNTFVIDPPGTTVQYAFTGTVTNTGIGPLYSVTLTDTFPANSSSTALASTTAGVGGIFTAPGTLVFASPLGAGQQFTYSGSYQNAGSNLTNNIGAGASSSPGGATLDVTSSTSLQQCNVRPTSGLTIVKSCVVSLQPVSGVGVVIQVDNTYRVCNVGQVQVASITVTDNKTLTNGTTTAGTISSLDGTASSSSPNCAPVIHASYRPPACTTDPSGGTCAFTDIGSVTTGTGALNTGTVQGGQILVNGVAIGGAGAGSSATCHLCPAGACSTTVP